MKGKKLGFHGPKSVCTCGHSGDGPNSLHSDRVNGVSPGHGACLMESCPCQKFTWHSFTPEYKGQKMNLVR